MKVVEIIKAKTPWARSMIRKYGTLCQLAADHPDKLRLVSIKEKDVENFVRWSYWVEKHEIEYEEFEI